MLTLNDGRKELYQWDDGRTANVLVDCDAVHFSNLKYGDSIPMEVIDGVVKIPNQLLTSGMDIYCYAFVEDGNGFYTKNEHTFSVIKRPKPIDYVYSETEFMNVEKAVNIAIQNAVESGDFKGEKGDRGERGERGQSGKDGKDGGYYTPFVVQNSTDSFTLAFEPNGEGMPGLPEFNIDLPVAPAPDNPSGASVQPDWSQNDPTAPDYVKNRTHWKETFPPIEWDGSTEGRDSFDATVLGFGMFYKVSDEVWTKEQAENAEMYLLYTNGSAGSRGGLNQVPLEDEAIGFAALYGVYGFGRVVVFFAKQAIDLTAVYGFSIPSAGCYFCVPHDTLVGIASLVLEQNTVFHKLGDEYLPDDLLRDGQLNLFPLIQHAGNYENNAIHLAIDGSVVGCENIFGEDAETDARIDDALQKSQASFDVYFGDNPYKCHACRVTFEHFFADGVDSSFGSCIVKDGDRLIRVNLEISKDLGIYNLWAESLVTKSDYDALEERIKALEG